MTDCIDACREPLRSILRVLHTWVVTTYPDTVVTEPGELDREGWIDYGVPDGKGGVDVFAGVRFRRDKPMGVTVVLAAKPEHDPMEWVHSGPVKVRPLGFAFGLPRPFEKSVPDESYKYVFDLVSQSRAAIVGTE
jgi:hypothetical protein